MDFTRRDFLKAGAATLAAGAAQARVPAPFFGLHPFIEANPKAVFIRRTRVQRKMDGPAKLHEGLTLAREIFVPRNSGGVPVSHNVVLKPNSCSVRSRNRPQEDTWGTGTDPQFYEGMIMGLKELGLKKFHFLEANNYESWNYHGYVDINERHGVLMNEPERRPRHFRESYDIAWAKVPDPVVYSRIPYFPPLTAPDTWLLSIAKWKAHGMCLSQAVKNEQGLVVLPFVRFCPGWRMVTGVPDYMKEFMNPRAEEMINSFFSRHVKMGYARYDSRAQLSPMNMEIWAHKTCDNMSVLNTGLAMIEGIIGRDGDGFGTGQDYLTNIVMFSKDKFRLDVIGLYLGGHEPGNVAVYRVAKERGLSDTFNPWEIPVFEWVDGKAVPRKLTDLPRTPLKTYYLQKEGEPQFHLVNEPFDYEKNKI